ncbi:NUDIX hydrolase [Rhodocaloribacter litoris]|uniref:NUDIX domain-containing protein n=1 Tax=Rhodocaloribacter litoris TaxID=2558931 RepID=UPI00142045C0|nr:NUDIX hydrolase [Rhodocaloribacter litoris]QXD16079.1 NUDIX hydrolase [Rhodocaloribacter litoris]
MLKRWKRLGTEVLFRNPWWTYRRDRFEIPGGVAGEYHYVHTNGSSMVVPLLDDGRVVLVRQYRYLCDRESLEFAAGSVKDGHTYDETARLELAEETGFEAVHLEPVGSFNPYNGVTDEMCRVYVATGLRPAAGAVPDATEEFVLERLEPPEVDRLIGENVLWDGMTLAAWILARPRVRELTGR